MKKIAPLVFSATLVMLLGCRSPRVQIAGALPIEYPGFQTFDTPRTFDGPGTVFRIDRKGFRFDVADLNAAVTNVGQEAFPAVHRNTKWSLGALAAFLGTREAAADADLNSTLELDVAFGAGLRFRTFDSDIDQALRNKKIELRKDSKYFVIRETIAITNMSFRLSKSLDASAEARAAFEKFGNVTGRVSRLDRRTMELSQTFDKPHHVFYTVDRIVWTVGLFEPRVERIPFTGTLRYKYSEADPKME